MLSWYSIRNRTGSFYHSKEVFPSVMEGLSLAYVIIYKTRGSFYHDLVYIIGGIHSIMDEIHVIMVFNLL